MRTIFFLAVPVAMLALSSTEACAGDDKKPIQIDLHYVFDTIGIVDGGAHKGARALAEADVTLTADLSHWLDVSSLDAGVHVLGAAGGRPNDLAGTLQGVDNIEVSDRTLKLYQLWLRKGLFGDRGSVLIGLVDLNTEFYQNDSAGLLLGPAFGIGSELAAAGPNGPSIFPSTALTVRLNSKIGRDGYARAAVVNAEAGVLGDAYSIRRMASEGVLVIGEAGITHDGKLAAGLWRYTKPQPTIRWPSLERAVAQGGYILAEHRLAGASDASRRIDAFFRAGVSDGETTSFKGGFQAGVLIACPVRDRPDGALSLGVNVGLLSNGVRRNMRGDGVASDDAETGIEITYRDTLTRGVAVQPDLQYIRRAFADQGRRGILVLGVRLTGSL